MAKVVVVEDDKITRKTIANLVCGIGDVVECEDGKEAWEHLCLEGAADLIISDIMMPDMDGRELLHLIRHDERFHETPVLIVSGEYGNDILNQIEESFPEQTRALPKPLEPKSFWNAIEELGFTKS